MTSLHQFLSWLKERSRKDRWRDESAEIEEETCQTTNIHNVTPQHTQPYPHSHIITLQQESSHSNTTDCPQEQNHDHCKSTLRDSMQLPPIPRDAMRIKSALGSRLQSKSPHIYEEIPCFDMNSTQCPSTRSSSISCASPANCHSPVHCPSPVISHSPHHVASSPNCLSSNPIGRIHHCSPSHCPQTQSRCEVDDTSPELPDPVDMKNLDFKRAKTFGAYLLVPMRDKTETHTCNSNEKCSDPTEDTITTVTDQDCNVTDQRPSDILDSELSKSPYNNSTYNASTYHADISSSDSGFHSFSSADNLTLCSKCRCHGRRSGCVCDLSATPARYNISQKLQDKFHELLTLDEERPRHDDVLESHVTFAPTVQCSGGTHHTLSEQSAEKKCSSDSQTEHYDINKAIEDLFTLESSDSVNLNSLPHSTSKPILPRSPLSFSESDTSQSSVYANSSSDNIRCASKHRYKQERTRQSASKGTAMCHQGHKHHQRTRTSKPKTVHVRSDRSSDTLSGHIVVGCKCSDRFYDSSGVCWSDACQGKDAAQTVDPEYFYLLEKARYNLWLKEDVIRVIRESESSEYESSTPVHQSVLSDDTISLTTVTSLSDSAMSIETDKKQKSVNDKQKSQRKLHRQKREKTRRVRTNGSSIAESEIDALVEKVKRRSVSTNVADVVSRKAKSDKPTGHRKHTKTRHSKHSNLDASHKSTNQNSESLNGNPLEYYTLPDFPLRTDTQSHQHASADKLSCRATDYHPKTITIPPETGHATSLISGVDPDLDAPSCSTRVPSQPSGCLSTFVATSASSMSMPMLMSGPVERRQQNLMLSDMIKMNHDRLLL